MTLHTPPSRPRALFEKYGGMRALHTVILDFYERVLDSDLVGPYFENVDMARLVDHQTKFFAMLMGGPFDFAEERLVRVHAHLGISHEEYDEIVTLLGQTLAAAGFAEDDRETVLRAVEARRPLIVA